ncbi:prohibitin family protein [Myxococcus sp. Y35]|uniref:prohibitin family protein n=1 Tax=Pseudomyxococcus flavus TaxID=3115648 RepID=UPI003CF160BF
MKQRNLRVQEMKDGLSVLSNNGLGLKVDASARYRVDPSKLFELHTQTGPRYADILIAPIVRSEARKVFGRYAPEEIYSTRREQLDQEAFDEVTRSLEGKHVVVEAILVRDVTLPTAIREAIADTLAEEQRSQRCASPTPRSSWSAARTAGCPWCTNRMESKGVAPGVWFR